MKSKSIWVIIPLLILTGFLASRILHLEPGAASGGHEHEHGDSHAEHEGHDHGKPDHVELTAEAFKNSGIVVEEAGPAQLPLVLRLQGKIAPDEDHTAHLMARFPGIVKSVHKRLGDKVVPGDTLAVIESNESLRPYEIKAMLGGTVIKKEIAPGEFVSDKESLFIISNLEHAWVDLTVHRSDFPKLKKGQPVTVDLGLGNADSEAAAAAQPLTGTLDWLSPFGSEDTQTMLARVIATNKEGLLRPGLFVTAEVTTATVEAPVTVKPSAIQILDDKPVVFVQQGDRFDITPVVLGVKTKAAVEIKSGLKAGELYASTNSFVLKAELLKAEASHEH